MIFWIYVSGRLITREDVVTSHIIMLEDENLPTSGEMYDRYTRGTISLRKGIVRILYTGEQRFIPNEVYKLAERMKPQPTSQILEIPY